MEKVRTGDASVQKYRNSVFKEHRNVDSAAAARAGLTVSSGAGGASLATGLLKVGVIDPSHGGAVFKSAAGGGTLGAFTKDILEGVVVDNITTTIPVTLTFHTSDLAFFGGSP